MTIAIREEQLLDELHKLAPERWYEVLNFIGYLRYQTQIKDDFTNTLEMKAKDLLDSGLVGMWSDRADITDSSIFARELRRSAETQRSQKPNAS